MRVAHIDDTKRTKKKRKKERECVCLIITHQYELSEMANLAFGHPLWHLIYPGIL
jgi:hypothetical protein